MKYNLALTPKSNNEEFIKLSQQLSNIADKYSLGKNSLPHITLYQFEIEENEIDNVWENVNHSWDEKPVNIELPIFSCITFDNNTFWVSLLPNNPDNLHKMHSIIANILKLPINKSFDPHMTLINTKNSDYQKEVAKLADSYVPLTDTFTLTLGKRDPVGQLTEIIYQHDLAKKISCSV